MSIIMDTQEQNQAVDERKSRGELRDERLQQFLESCQKQVLQQIIGPFGLTPAMFDDKKGGNVTTQLNAEKGIFAKKSEELNRSDYKYGTAKKEIKEASVKDGSMNSRVFEDQYTGKKESTTRTNAEGKLVMNAELDHLISVKDIHREGGWIKDKAGRTKLSSEKENLHYTTMSTNRSKGGKSPEEALSAENGFDQERIKPLKEKARAAINDGMPTTAERVKYHGKELALTGAKDAAKNALRQALGVVMYEFVNGSFVEIKHLLQDRNRIHNLIDSLIESLKRVTNNVISKLKKVLEAAIQGGIQGFVSNLLTFLINNLITTSKKIVTIIRESMNSLWAAIKLLMNPPPAMSALEITREVTKIIAAVVTAGIGIAMEESVKGFITSIPFLVPVADVLSAALTAIVTGIASALVVYGIDSIFDFLDGNDTDLLQAQETNVEAQYVVAERLQTWLAQQYENSRLYAAAEEEYRLVCELYSTSSFHAETACLEAGTTINSRDAMIDTIQAQIDCKQRLALALEELTTK